MTAEKSNIICGLYPITKLVIAVCCIVLAFVLPDFVTRLCLVVFIQIAAIISGKYKSFIKYFLLTIGVLALFILLIQSLFYQGTNPEILWTLGILSIKYEGILYGLKIASAVLAFGSAILLFFQTTSIKDFIYSLEKSGLSSKAAYVVLATLQMIPQMRKRSQVIMSAQKARGVETEGNVFVRAKAFIPTLGPLVLSSIAGTEEKALTLEARGFSSSAKKTHLFKLDDTKRDKVICIIAVIITLILIIWRIAAWLI
ncbi:energy-coupling factor transporter transmembrane component T family protein [Scopulibacillus cellulosilyticus]|uniref:Energy-coupling factor transporter transmembrane component T family protein n=1 Tax=Scopulibacillus cellulosilyticus TaxID=2665665 RepID=A0ABW2Q381_9BACL